MDENSNLGDNTASSPSAPSGRSSVTRFVILIAVSFVAVPVLISELPREIARWHLAAAMEDFLDGDRPAGSQHLDDALAWDSQSADIFLTRARTRAPDDLQGGLEDCHKAIELAPNRLEGYRARGEIYLKLKRYREAVDDLQEVERRARESTLNRITGVHAAALNELAYYRAVGQLELDEGLKNIEEALSKSPPNAAFLDTRGYLHYLLGNLVAAQKDLDDAVKGIEKGFADALRTARHSNFDIREANVEILAMAQSVAVIRYHRALVLTKLDKREQAEQDLKRVRDLGYEPNDDLY